MPNPMTPKPEGMKVVSINEEELSVIKIVAVSRFFAEVELFKGSKRKKVEQLRKYVEENWFGNSAEPKYGFNTGIGSLKNVRISDDDIDKFQRLYVKSHSVGVGNPLPIEVVRGSMLLQANALSKGYSGVRAVVIDKLIEMLNKRIHPVVPGQGSLGASGDLAPLNHIASVLVGEDEAEIRINDKQQKLKYLKNTNGHIHFTRDGEKVSFEPISLKGKEAISLTNSTAVMLSFAIHLLHDVEILLKNADIAAALSLEAMMAEKNAFDEQLNKLRNQPGQIQTARNIRKLIENSSRMRTEARVAFFKQSTEQALNANLKNSPLKDSMTKISAYKFEHEFEKNRVQDAYSLRCIPQVHGACKDTFRFVQSIIENEIAAVTDNPVIFPSEDDGYEVKSGGNFHGEPLALALDFLAIAVAEIGSISERRTFRLLSPHMSFGLPPNLSGGEVGLNSGYMMTQYTGAQLVSENKILAHPASVDSIPTSDNQEDHVSMGLTAARKARKIVNNVQVLLAIEYLCAVQGIHLSSRDSSVDLSRFPLGKGTSIAYDFIKNYKTKTDGVAKKPFQLMIDDTYLHSKMEAMRTLSSEGVIVNEVEKSIKVEF